MAREGGHTVSAPGPSAGAETPVQVLQVDSLRIDSLQIAARRTERAQSYPFPVYGTADSLHLKPAYTRGPVYRDGTPEEVFGEGSVLIPPRTMSQDAKPTLVTNSGFEGLVLLLTAAYILLLIRNLGEVKLLFRRLVRNAQPTERFCEEPAHSGFSRFLTFVVSLGVLYLGVLVVKYGDSLLPGSVIEVLPRWMILSMSLLAAAACVLVAGYQTLVIRLAGAVTIAQAFAAQLLFIRRVYFAIGTVVIAPVLLLFALCPPGEGEGWFAGIVILLALILLMFLRETFNLFISQKISILHWFLYLCTVEIFPISFLLLMAAR